MDLAAAENTGRYRKALGARLQPLTNDSLNVRRPLYIFYKGVHSRRYNLYFPRQASAARKIRIDRPWIRFPWLRRPLLLPRYTPAPLVSSKRGARPGRNEAARKTRHLGR